jgi:hypothetical protein
MTKIGVNEPCPCSSGKKYKKCCQSKDLEEKRKKLDEINKLEKIYLNGQEEHTAKMNFCIEHYIDLFPDCKIINLTEHINKDNYKQILTLNYNKNTIILVERNISNEELFSEKSNLESNDLILIYKGAYKTFEALDILKYDKDISNMITNRDNGLTI